MILAAFDGSTLADSLTLWEWGEYIAEVFVIIACAGEVIPILFKKRLTEEHRESIEKYATFLLVAALSVGLLCLIKTNVLSGMVIVSLGDQAAEAGTKAKKAVDDSSEALKKSGTALDESGKAKDAADKATVAVGDAQKRVEAVEKEADLVEYALSARHVEDEDGLAKDLKREFKGSHIIFTSYWDEESIWLCNQLAKIADTAEVGPINKCGDEPLVPGRPQVEDLFIEGPDHEQAMLLSHILKASPKRVPGMFVGLREAPKLSVLVGVQRKTYLAHKPRKQVKSKTTARQ